MKPACAALRLRKFKTSFAFIEEEKMKFAKVLVCLLLVSGLVLTGCGKSGESSEKVELVVWESTNGPDQFIEEAGKAFTALHPNVTIKYVNVELGDSTGQITLDGPAGVGPDVFAAPHDKLGELVMGGHVLPTNNAQAVADSVLAACSQALTYEGTMYGYPVSAETYALFYNRALVNENEVPKTWEDMITFCKEFNAENPGKYGLVFDAGNAYYSIVFTTAHGNRLFGEGGTDTSRTYLNTDAAVEGMTFFQNFRKEALNVPAADLTTSVADAAFFAGTAAMHITGPWNVANCITEGLNFGITTLPSLPGDTTPASSFSGTRAMFVSAYSEHPEEANAFAEFLVSPEMQKLRFDITGALPSISVTVDSPYVNGFLAQLDYAFPMPSIPEMNAFWDALGSASSNIWNGADVKAELDAADAAILSR